MVLGNPPTTLSICEFTTQILPDGTIDTLTGAAVPTETCVWGYQIGDICHPKPDHSYIGPVVVAERGTPTQMTYINQLGNTWDSNVLAYTQNTDQTMHWADPLNAEHNLCSEQLTTMEFGGTPEGMREQLRRADRRRGPPPRRRDPAQPRRRTGLLVHL